MRLRLVHHIALVLMGTVLLAVLAMGALVAWNLRSGFSDYLHAQDAELLDRMMRVAEADLRQEGGWPRGDLRALLRDWIERTAPQDAGPRPPESADSPSLDPPPEPRPPPTLQAQTDPTPPWHPPPAPPPPRRAHDPAQLGQRVLLLDASGQQLLAGRRELWSQITPKAQRRALKLDGQLMAILLLLERRDAPEGVDARFLQRQYRGIALIGAVLLVFSFVLAQWLGRRWLRPLQRAQQAARRYARGDFELRIRSERHDELGALMHDLDAMADALQRLDQDRRRWIAQLSHELRTPLAVLRGELEALADGVRPWDRRALASLHDEVLRLNRLIEDFHTLAVSGLQRLPCQFAPLHVPALLEQAVQRVQERARVKGLRLDLDVASTVGAATWDGDRIAQLLGNLLENSLRYTDAPGRIVLSARQRGAQLEICVDDSPPGLPPEALRHLFEPLFRADASRSRASGGSGLGLSIARALAHSHGGQLQAEPSPLGGLRQCLCLPLTPPESKPGAEEARHALPCRGANRQPRAGGGG